MAHKIFFVKVMKPLAVIAGGAVVTYVRACVLSLPLFLSFVCFCVCACVCLRPCIYLSLSLSFAPVPVWMVYRTHISHVLNPKNNPNDLQGYTEWSIAAEKLHLNKNKEEMSVLFNKVQHCSALGQRHRQRQRQSQDKTRQ
jgi:hypothetical protein